MYLKMKIHKPSMLKIKKTPMIRQVAYHPAPDWKQV